MSKICNICSIEKSLDCFHKDTTKSDGHQSRCKPCLNQYSRQYVQQKRKQTNATQKAYNAKRLRKNPTLVAVGRLRNRLLAALNKGNGSASSCMTLFGKTKENFEVYLHARHGFGMDAARNYTKHAPQPRFKPESLTDDQRLHFVEQRTSVLTYDHTVPIDAFDLSIPLDDDGTELFQKKFSYNKPLPTPWARVAFSYLNTKRMWAIENFKKGTTPKNNSKELLLEKYLRNNPWI